jgi:hypothetical protein
MGMFLPLDISERIGDFIAGKLDFPFISKEEIMGMFCLFGKDYGINGQTEILSATDLARRTIEQFSRNVSLFHNMPNKINSNSVREDYLKRALQISIELRYKTTNRSPKLNERVAGDPTILSNCFVQHIAFYKRNYYFELFQPFRKNDLPISLKGKLEGRMLLLGFNVKNLNALPYESSIAPFIYWLNDTSENASKV